jgi:leucyl-tRNA synthetase|tara:strand:- start:3174 stop:5813 length:2640 start_codon:yes stop_codon:yes gene_type:complete
MVDLNKISRKWQKKWQEKKIFEVKEDPKKKKYYVLEMYPYPSGSGLHMGHARNYCIGDCYARYKRMQGFNVLYPMGYDSFGLPAENAAIKAKSHPKIFTEDSIKNFIKQQKELGLSYDWSRMIASHTLEYYKWDQWIFLKIYEKGLAYKKKAAVNWCPKCNTVLANEQVHDGKCWRHTEQNVTVKELSQWFFKITKYGDELLEDIDKLKGWAEDVKIMQKNWIGKSHGTKIHFKIDGTNDIIPIFTTRTDTLFGVTFMVYAPEHPKVMELVKGTKYENNVKKFVRKVVLEDKFTRTAEDREKEGMFIGKYAINPVNNKKVPIYIGNFVLLEYGAGCVMAVPAHDQRDFEFAKKYNIPIKVVITPQDHELKPEKMTRAYLDNGVMVNSGEFNGIGNRDAVGEITNFLRKNRLGKKTIQYKLRDWLISRQRFWGCPIPIIYCDKCGVVPVSEKDLPVKLPENYKFAIGKGNPLEHCKEFVNTKCPKCNGKAKRETDTMDTFVDSSWYFLRYCDAKNNKEIFDKKKAAYWMPIDMYIGGKEHATMHLIYFRFFTKFLRDIGLLKIDEPTLNLFNQGMLHKNGVVMSKSKGNVVTQNEIAEKYGIDTARFFLLFVSGPDKDMEWDDKAILGSCRFLDKVYALAEKKVTSGKDAKSESKMHKTIKLVTENIENFRFNTALVHLMEFVNYLSSKDKATKKSLEAAALLLNPFTPHLSEELWEKVGNKQFASMHKWPSYDEKKIDKKMDAEDDLIQNTISDIIAVMRLAKVEKPVKIRLFTAEKWKYNFLKKLKKEMGEKRNVGELIKAVMDREHGKEISSLVPKLVKDPKKIPEVVIENEFEVLKENIEAIEKEFNCKVEVIKAEQSQEGKAKQAMPGKVAILVE